MNPALRDILDSFSPLSLSGLTLWLDASDASSITLNGSTVSQWSDKSGNAKHAVQASATQQPSYTAGIVSFDGTDDNMLASDNLTSATASSMFIVLRYRSTGSGHGIACGYGTASTFSCQLLEKGRTAGKIGYTVGRNAPSGAEATLAGSNTTTVRCVQGSIYSGTTLTGYINNVADGTVSFTGPLNSTGGFTIGRYFTILPCDVDVNEVVHYSRAVTPEERYSLFAYFSARWEI